jgi:tRNA(Ile)-lysidine synthetase-like protein
MSRSSLWSGGPVRHRRVGHTQPCIESAAGPGTMANVEFAPVGVSADSLPSALLGGLAQVVEQPVHTRYVPGSNPGTATTPGSTGTLAPRERTAAVARVRRAVATAVDRRGVIVPGEHVLIACSGGPDSSALVDALARLAPPRRWHLSVAHVDHGLRPGSSREAHVVARLASDRGLPFMALSVEVGAGGSLQDRARDARHAALRTEADRVGAGLIALGHTADDQAETVLMRALAGASPKGLVAMGERERRLVRPLLRVWREATIAYCAALGIEALDDPSNVDPRFLRSRVRHQVIPALEAVFPGARRRLVVLAERQRRLLTSAGGVEIVDPW